MVEIIALKLPVGYVLHKYQTIPTQKSAISYKLFSYKVVYLQIQNIHPTS